MSTSNGAPALSVSGLYKSYGTFQVLKNLDLKLNRGAILGLVGLNGSGKTTTIECLLGLQGADSGSISLLGYTPATLYRARGKVVGIFDSPSLHPNLTVRQNMKHAALLSAATVRSPMQVEALLGIERYSHFKVRSLSLGNKRRASLAQALLGNPELVVLDEPFNGLDAGGVDEVLALIRHLNREEGATFLLSSHQLPYLESICTHIAILHRGRIALSKAMDELLADTRHTVLLKTQPGPKVPGCLKGREDVRVINPNAGGYIELEISGLDSSELNRQLVENNIPVSELIVQKTSLGKLFRSITNEERV